MYRKLVCLIFVTSLLVSVKSNDGSNGQQNAEIKEYTLVDETGVLNSSAIPNRNTLKKLKLKDCTLQSVAPFTFSALPKLRKLIIDHTKIEDVPEGVLKNCISLEEIKIKQSTIGKLHLSTFTNLPVLRELNIENTNIGDLKNGMFAGSLRLQELECDSCGIENVEFGALDGLSRLEELDLKNNKIAKFSFTDLPVLPNLKTLTLSGNPLTSIDASKIQEKCPNLKKIKLKRVTVKPELEAELEKLNIKVKKGN